MAKFIEIEDLCINLDRVRVFWWEQVDTFHAYLYLGYGDGDVMPIEDPYQAKYIKVRQAAGLP